VTIPAILITNGTRWTTRFQTEFLAGNTRFTPWRDTSIVNALVHETHGKCAYCEGIIADVAAPNVEHILPKALRPDLVVEWRNLTLACPACNSAKGTYYSETAPLLNPYEDDPEEHLEFAGPVVMGRLGDDLGQRAVSKLKLLRGNLILERSKRIQQLADQIDRWFRASDPDEKLIYAEVVNDALNDEVEFAATLRAYARLRGFPVESQVTSATISR
jgi:uncharacterized protein (TIGR02646 family)